MLSNRGSDAFMHKYHFRGESPRLLSAGVHTKLARRYENVTITEENLHIKEKYKDLFAELVQTGNPGKNTKRKCMLCATTHKDVGVSISNFMKHVRNLHRAELTATDQEKMADDTSLSINSPTQQSSFFQGSPSPSPFSSSSWTKKVTSLAFSSAIRHGAYPLSMVENSAVRHLVQEIVTGVVPKNIPLHFPSRRTVTRQVVDDLREEEVVHAKKIAALLTENECITIPITNDCSASKNSIPYSALTTSIINKEFSQMFEVVLGCDYFPPPHTAVSVSVA